MAKLCLISLSLCFIVLFHGSRLTQAYIRQEHQQQQQQSQCQLQRLNAAQPNKRIESEGGVTEHWDENDEQFECAGVAATRHTIQPRGLLLPHFSNSPKLTYIVQGRGIQGAVIPGCPETYELLQQSQQGGQSQQEKQQQQPEQKQEQEQQHQQPRREQEQEQEQEREQKQQQQQQQQPRREQEQEQQQQQQQQGQQQDRHQKIKDLRQGDIVAMPSGVVNWFYNDGNRPLVLVTIHHTQNSENQLDQTQREFFLAGNPRQQQQQQQGKQGKGSQQEEQGGQQSENNSNNIFQAFDDQILAVAFGVRRETVRKLKSQNDRRGNIVRVENGLQFVRPPRTEQEEDRQQGQQRQQGQEQQQESMTGNGIEETFCTIRYRENIGEPIRADIFNPQGGRLRSINSGTLPILKNLQLSAERGVLYRNALMAPHWNMNANSVIYVTEGSARIQVAGNYQRPVFDGQLGKGQLLVVPQNFAVVKQAGSNGFEWVAFKTNDNAMTSPVAGKTSALSAMPVDVLVNAYQGLSRQEAMNLKNNRRSETLILSPRSSSQGGRDYA